VKAKLPVIALCSLFAAGCTIPHGSIEKKLVERGPDSLVMLTQHIAYGPDRRYVAVHDTLQQVVYFGDKDVPLVREIQNISQQEADTLNNQATRKNNGQSTWIIYPRTSYMGRILQGSYNDLNDAYVRQHQVPPSH